ncbi:PREDICTED: zinc finger BED domain-containing protein RICESLEEPER 1-like [Ipomoea nil]|uniref:zinc finger BED domain-containing protein RICESLEEPER 1-like n=1 Tax=Ipomoea nil TaxID=35883 RepID=UPI00090114CA|nr:PREDICTED: zinc finger BED domain-containing protein RICESLEEPER 1-like [Ipomoea nil]
MLNTAIQYQAVFDAYLGNDPSFSDDLGTSVPTFMDWFNVKSLVTLLKTFYDMTVRISGSLYVTSNTFFSEISDLSCMLDDMTCDEAGPEKVMGTQMKTKFLKYWGDPEKMNFVIFFGTILDPRDKVEYMPAQLTQLYGDEKGKSCFEKIQSALLELYNDYAATYSVDVNPEPAAVGQPSQTVSVSVQPSAVTVGRPQGKLKSQLKRQRMESGGSLKQTDLQIYLSEAIVEDKVDFDILKWWKVNSERLPILSKMARDILAVPISTVASESAFSTSGRVLDPFRSSLTPKIVEALICTQDWLRLPNQPIQIEENIDDCERLEKELPTGIRTAGTSLPTIVCLSPYPQFHLIEHLNSRLQEDEEC